MLSARPRAAAKASSASLYFRGSSSGAAQGAEEPVHLLRGLCHAHFRKLLRRFARGRELGHGDGARALHVYIQKRASRLQLAQIRAV